MCAMFMLKKRPEKDERIVTRPVGVRDKSGFCYITCSWCLEFGCQRVQIAFSRDNMCVYIDGEPIETTMLVKDQGYDVHIWWESPLGNFYIFSDVDVNKRHKPMINYLYCNDCLVSKKHYKEHKQKEKVPVPPRRALDIYLQECELEQQQKLD